MDDASTQFRAMAERIYPSDGGHLVNSLCSLEYVLGRYERDNRTTITTFEDYLVATRRRVDVNDRESRTWFEAWQRVRRQVERGR